MSAFCSGGRQCLFYPKQVQEDPTRHALCFRGAEEILPLILQGYHSKIDLEKTCAAM